MNATALVRSGMDKDTALFLSRLAFLRPAEKDKVAERVQRPEDFRNVSPADLETWLGRRVRAVWSWRDLVQGWTQDRRSLERGDTVWLHRDEAAFPAALREIAGAPWGLWVRGSALALDRAWVAVVGTRLPDEAAKRAAYTLGRDLAAAGAVVVSGLARGIDGQAHRGALESGLTVAVLGHGIDTVAPASHRPLARRLLAAGGSLVSEYGPGEPAFPYRFVERNRLISGLARTVVVVQAPRRSGALSTADFALDQGRDVLVHERGLAGERGEGTRRLADEGAGLIAGAAEILGLWTDGRLGRRAPQGEFTWGDQ